MEPGCYGRTQIRLCLCWNTSVKAAIFEVDNYKEPNTTLHGPDEVRTSSQGRFHGGLGPFPW